MSEVNFEMKVIPDEEGFISFQCPFCNSDFMADYSKIDNLDEVYCSYCGLTDSVDAFYPEEVIEEAKKIAINYATDELNKMFGKMSKRSNDFVKVSYKPMKKLEINNIICKECEARKYTCKTCGKTHKALFSNKISMIYCPYCGDNI